MYVHSGSGAQTRVLGLAQQTTYCLSSRSTIHLSFVCSSLVSVDVVITATKGNLEVERVYMVYTSRSQSLTEGSQGRNLEAGPMKEHRSLVCWHILSKLSSIAWAHFLTMVLSQHTGPFRTNRQSRQSQTWPETSPTEAITQLRPHLSRGLYIVSS